MQHVFSFFLFEFRKALCQAAATTKASKRQHSTFPHIRELPKALKAGSNSRIALQYEQMLKSHATMRKPDTSKSECSRAAKELWINAVTSEPEPANRAYARHQHDTAEARPPAHREQQKEETCNTCKKTLESNSHSRVTSSNTSKCSKRV